MVPTAAIVPCPRCRISLAPGIGCPRQYERAGIRIERSKPLERCPRVLQAINRVNLSVACGARHEARFVDTMHNVLRHGPCWRLKDGRLVHIVPEAVNAAVTQIAIKRTPPRTSLLAREVWKHTGAGPDSTCVNRPVRILHKMVPCNAAVVSEIALPGKVRDMRISDGHDMEIFRLELRDHSRKIGESCPVHREGAILILVVDVEIDCVGRNRIGSQSVCNFQHTCLRHVAVTRLLEAEGP